MQLYLSSCCCCCQAEVPPLVLISVLNRRRENRPIIPYSLLCFCCCCYKTATTTNIRLVVVIVVLWQQLRTNNTWLLRSDHDQNIVQLNCRTVTGTGTWPRTGPGTGLELEHLAITLTTKWWLLLLLLLLLLLSYCNDDELQRIVIIVLFLSLSSRGESTRTLPLLPLYSFIISTLIITTLVVTNNDILTRETYDIYEKMTDICIPVIYIYTRRENEYPSFNTFIDMTGVQLRPTIFPLYLNYLSLFDLYDLRGEDWSNHICCCCCWVAVATTTTTWTTTRSIISLLILTRKRPLSTTNILKTLLFSLSLVYSSIHSFY